MNYKLAEELANDSYRAEPVKYNQASKQKNRKCKYNWLQWLCRGYKRLNGKQKVIFVSFWVVVFGIAFSVAYALSRALSSAPKHNQKSPIYEYVNPTSINIEYRFIGSYGKTFDDINALHLQAAQQGGVPPSEIDFSSAETMRSFLQVKSDSVLMVAKLSHSEPYLVRSAFLLLNDIAVDFSRRLRHYNLPPHRIIVTSLTRSEEQRERLSRVNANASENSAHCYGTTFDISWSRFDPITKNTISDAVLKQHLAAILVQYQQAGRCYIKHERRQACFHITAIGQQEQLAPLTSE